MSQKLSDWSGNSTSRARVLAGPRTDTFPGEPSLLERANSGAHCEAPKPQKRIPMVCRRGSEKTIPKSEKAVACSSTDPAALFPVSLARTRNTA